MTPALDRIVVRKLRIPLPKPYKVAFNTYHSFDPIIVEVRDDDDRGGFGEAHVPPNYSASESPGAAWRACLELAQGLVGYLPGEAKRRAAEGLKSSPMAATAIISAIEMLERHPALEAAESFRIPLVVPLSSHESAAIREEVDRHIAMGYRTIKVKVGWDVEADLARVDEARRAVGGRALLRLDANRNFSVEDGRRFAAALEPEGIELFEQPCGTHEWTGNAAVAAASRVPVMLDESIYTSEDVERAAQIPNVKLVKLKLKRAGGVERLVATLIRARELGIEAIVGDGVATELTCWMEACCARAGAPRAGEMNGFLKPSVRLFAEPLAFEEGALCIPRGFRADLDAKVMDELTHEAWVMERDAAPVKTVANAR